MIYDKIESVKNEHSQKFGYNDRHKLSVNANIEFIDHVNEKSKNVKNIVYHVLNLAAKEK